MAGPQSNWHAALAPPKTITPGSLQLAAGNIVNPADRKIRE
jgi:hypothetical protein